uniref:Major facilitator superfamily (MFS) profile domain-containing protein n=1 Tax=Haptolina ericina TaxID=156174 RepID=A0A7S3B8P8_9EUKA
MHIERGYTIYELVSDRTLRRQLLIACGVQLSMQLSGIDVMLVYSTMVFRMAGVKDPQLATTTLGLVNLVTSLLAVTLTGRIGRRPLLLLSWAGLLISYLLIIASFIAYELLDEAERFTPSLTVAAAFGVVVSFAVGPGCVGWLVVDEVLPPRAKDAAMAIGTTINWLASWFVVFTFPLMQRAFGPYTFLVFVCFAILFGLFTYAFIPETKSTSITGLAQRFEAW